MLTTELTVERWSWVKYSKDAPRGSGYCEDQGQENLLVKRWKFKGVTIWKKVLDREEIPSFIWIQEACLGGHNGWQSKFKEYMK